MGNFEEKERRFRLENRSLELLSSSNSPFFGPHSIFTVKNSEEYLIAAPIKATEKRTLAQSQSFAHPNLLRTLAADPKWTHLFIKEPSTAFFEFCPWTLAALISRKRRENSRFNEPELVFMLKAIIKALAYLQRNGVSHGNLTPQLIFFDNETGNYKLLDQELISGYLSCFALWQTARFYSFYVSPEVLVALQEKDVLLVRNAFRADCFSLGMCLLEAATLLPNKGIYDMQGLKIRVREIEERMNVIRRIYSFEFYKVVEALLTFEPGKRFDALEMQRYLEGEKTIEIKTKKLKDWELPKIIEEINIRYSAKERDSQSQDQRTKEDSSHFPAFHSPTRGNSLKNSRNVRISSISQKNEDSPQTLQKHGHNIDSPNFSPDSPSFRKPKGNLPQQSSPKPSPRPTTFLDIPRHQNIHFSAGQKPTCFSDYFSPLRQTKSTYLIRSELKALSESQAEVYCLRSRPDGDQPGFTNSENSVQKNLLHSFDSPSKP